MKPYLVKTTIKHLTSFCMAYVVVADNTHGPGRVHQLASSSKVFSSPP